MAATEPSSEHVVVEFDAGIQTIRFNRPRKKNALSVAMYAAAAAALNDARKRGEVRVIVLRGSEGVFTAGNDLADFMKAGGIGGAGTDTPVTQFIDHLVDCEKPVIAAVEGVAIGIGVTMLLHCDLVYAGEKARFHMPFVNLALCPEAGSSFMLPRIMGHQRASELILLGEPFSAQTAHEYGIVNQVLADSAVVDRALSSAAALAAKPPAALRRSKQLLRAGYRETLRTAIEAEYEGFSKGLASPEAAEAFAAFFEKRAPDFSRFE